jgi:hypothetical protein
MNIVSDGKSGEDATIAAQREWISVKDKLPEKTCWALVYADGAMNCMGYDQQLRKWEDWTYNESGCHNICVAGITHWMPLPDPPITGRMANRREKELIEEIAALEAEIEQKDMALREADELILRATGNRSFAIEQALKIGKAEG